MAEVSAAKNIEDLERAKKLAPLYAHVPGDRVLVVRDPDGDAPRVEDMTEAEGLALLTDARRAEVERFRGLGVLKLGDGHRMIIHLRGPDATTTVNVVRDHEAPPPGPAN